MNIQEIIAKKRDKKELQKEEIEYFVQNYTKGEITDYQAAALVMAIYINGMTEEEMVNLTIAMAHSGDILDLSEFGLVVDKHSTGGVGDKITLILMPIMAALGVQIAKMSGRGLGFTGGTADKLEAIPGYQTRLSEEEFKKNVREIGISLMTQTGNLAPADKKIYALRDTIACVDNIPLIASSIMSKKIASGANKLVLDVTCGNGAFMKTREEAENLAIEMKKIGNLAGLETVCVITSMEEPLGYAIGNELEVREAHQALKGNMPEDVKQIVEILGAYMLKLAGKGENLEENKKKVNICIESGLAYEKWEELIKRQGGNVKEYQENMKKVQKAHYLRYVVSNQEGYVQRIEAQKIGEAACLLGAGRKKKEDEIDKEAGIMLNKKVGEYVSKGERIATLYTNDIKTLEEATQRTESAIIIEERPVEKNSIILQII